MRTAEKERGTGPVSSHVARGCPPVIQSERQREKNPAGTLVGAKPRSDCSGPSAESHRSTWRPDPSVASDVQKDLGDTSREHVFKQYTDKIDRKVSHYVALCRIFEFGDLLGDGVSDAADPDSTALPPVIWGDGNFLDIDPCNSYSCGDAIRIAPRSVFGGRPKPKRHVRGLNNAASDRGGVCGLVPQ